MALTDNEIIKALECCLDCECISDCEDCPIDVEECLASDKGAAELSYPLVEKIIDLINRQKAEIEKHKRKIENLESMQEISPEAKHFVDTKADKVISLLNEVIKSQEQIKSEAIKEFADDVLEEIERALENNCKVRMERLDKDIDVSDDIIIHYCDGKIDCLKGIQEYVKEKVGDNDESTKDS